MVQNRELLIRNLFRQIEKDRLKLINQLCYNINEIALETKNNKERITMIIKIEDIK